MAKIQQSDFYKCLYIFGILTLSFISISCTSEVNRSIYCVSSKKCVTVLKKTNGEVQIVYGNYKNNKEPSNNFITVKNVQYATIILSPDQKLILDLENKAEILNNSFDKDSILMYKNSKVFNDSLFTYLDGKYRRYKEEVKYVSFDIKENYAMDKRTSQ